MRLSAVIILWGCLAASAIAADAKPRVSFVLVTKPGVPLTAAQQWHKALADLGVSGLQIRSAGDGDEMTINEQSKGEYKVTGILGSDNQLYVPGGKFALNDKARLRKWIDTLGDEGAEGVTEKRSAFGLTPGQLTEVNDDLKTPVIADTRDASVAKTVRSIGGRLHLKVEVDPSATGELKGKIADELSGLSSGTALAAMLRPCGLVLMPSRPSGGELHYRVARPQSGRESWPVGWRPKGPTSKALPELFEFLNAEIDGIPLAEALDAIQGRLKVPFLFDHNALEKHGVDLTKIEAKLPGKRLSYSQILNRLLAQAKLRYELRVDEGDRPFLWITTIKS